jgi:hypothetical protein
MRRRIDALVVGLLVLGIAALLAWPQPDRVTQENFDRIRPAMTRAEVEAILGPPGDYTTGPVTNSALKQYLGHGTWLDWQTDTAWVTIVLDEPGGVAQTRFVKWARLEQGPLDNLLWRAKRQLNRWLSWPRPRRLLSAAGPWYRDR